MEVLIGIFLVGVVLVILRGVPEYSLPVETREQFLERKYGLSSQEIFVLDIIPTSAQKEAYLQEIQRAKQVRNIR